jgi:hypothetical protein
MNISRLTTALLVLEITLTVLLCAGAVSRAIDLNDLGISRPGNLDINSITDNAGLGGTMYAQCAGSLLSLFDANLGDRLRQMASAVVNSMTSRLTAQFSDCLWRNGLYTLTHFGSRVLGGIVPCNFVPMRKKS